MPISYQKLFMLMEQKGIKKIDLRNKYGINPKTVNSLVNDKSVTVDTITELCEILNCQPGDIMEYIKDGSVLRWEKAELRKFIQFIPDKEVDEYFPPLLELIRTKGWYDLSDDERFSRFNELIESLKQSKG